MDERGREWTRVDESGREWTRVDESGREWTRVDESGREWTTRVDESGREWTRVDESGREGTREWTNRTREWTNRMRVVNPSICNPSERLHLKKNVNKSENKNIVIYFYTVFLVQLFNWRGGGCSNLNISVLTWPHGTFKISPNGETGF